MEGVGLGDVRGRYDLDIFQPLNDSRKTYKRHTQRCYYGYDLIIRSQIHPEPLFPHP